MKMIAITASVFTVITVGIYISIITSEIGIMQLHPELDKKSIVKAHRIMLARTLRNQIELDDSSDDAVDAQFLGIYHEIHNK